VKIYIDQGFNPKGYDTKSSPDGREEEDLTYEIGVHLAASLEARGYEIKLSRSDAATEPVMAKQTSFASRAADANDWGADYFISLRLASSSDPYANGVEAMVAKPMGEITKLAKNVLEGFSQVSKCQNRGVKARGDALLHRLKMPAMTLNMGFITNKRDFTFVSNNPEQCAVGIAKGIAETFERTPGGEETLKRSPFFQLYPQGRRNFCNLYVFVGKEDDKTSGVSNADLLVYYGTHGRHMPVYRGKTNARGLSIPIELPLNLSEEDKPPFMFCVCVRHEHFLPKNQWVKVKNERVLRTNIYLSERRLRMK